MVKQQNLMSACESDPNSFWKMLDKIWIAGERKQNIPMEVKCGYDIVTNTEMVLDRWKDYFKDIYIM